MTMQPHIQDLYNKKESLDLKWKQEHLNKGKYTLDMVRIDDQVKKIVQHIKAAEAKQAHLRNKVDAAAPQVSVAT